MLGGGTFTVQNKKLPGAYINFVSAARASATLSDRGIAAMAVPLSWGPVGEVIKLEQSDFLYSSRRILGYDYADDALKGLRDLFMGAQTVYLYRLNSTATKAKNTFAEALYAGVRGNDFSVVIETNADSEEKFDVMTYLGTTQLDIQTVADASELVDNSWLHFLPEAELEQTAKTPLTGGTDGTVTAGDWQSAIAKLEGYSFNTFGAATVDESVKKLVVQWTKRMRDERGVKFQTVVYDYAEADYEGVISVNTAAKTASAAASAKAGSARVGESKAGGDDTEAGAVYWVTGAQAGCRVQSSLTNATYTGETELVIDDDQSKLETAIDSGMLVFHRVGDEVRVLTDINTLTTFTEEKSEDFSKNQTIRVIDQIGNDIAVIFNTQFLGKVNNDQSGRISFWSQIDTHHKKMKDIRAIENYDNEDIVVMAGEEKGSVVVNDAVQPTSAMEKLYMTVRVN